MGFFKNINANVDFEALERYIKNEEWKINNSSNSSLFSGYYNYCNWKDSFDTVFDVPWYFKLVNGIYMIDSRILFEGAIYHNIHEIRDYTRFLFQAMIDKKPIHVIAGAKHVDNRHIVIRLIFDIDNGNGNHQFIIYEGQRKIKIRNTVRNTGNIYNPKYNFNHNYTKQQQKFAKRYAGRNRW